MVTLDTPCKEIKNIILSRNIKKIIIRSLGIDIIIYNQSNYWWGALPKQQIITILPSASGDSEKHIRTTLLKFAAK